MKQLKITNANRSGFIDLLVEYGDLVRLGGDYFEDMGGHVLHESNLDYYIQDWFMHLPASEQNQLTKDINL